MVDYYAYDFGSRLTSLHATGNGTDAAAYYSYDANSQTRRRRYGPRSVAGSGTQRNVNCTVKVVNNNLVTTYYTSRDYS